MSRVLLWLRLVVCGNAVAFAAARWETVEVPWVAVTVLSVIVLWTAFCTWAYADHSRRTPALLTADLALAVGALVATPLAKGEDFTATLPGFWVMAAVLVWAAHWGARGGFVAALAVAVADLGIRWPDISESNYGNVFLLLIGGPLLGRLASALKDLAAQRDAAQRVVALAEERARLARVVHDGVLQVLALMQRRGPDLGPDGAELGRLAGEQEARLRALVQVRSAETVLVRAETGPGHAERGHVVDLVPRVAALATRRTPAVQVSAPAGRVEVPQQVADELVAAAGAALDNIALHVGAHATAWVLLEDTGEEIVLSVRDDGPGIASGRLETAAAEGRLGVSESIVGRLHDLGGHAALTSDQAGTEWELVVSREAL